jgi:hypothetical protein
MGEFLEFPQFTSTTESRLNMMVLLEPVRSQVRKILRSHRKHQTWKLQSEAFMDANITELWY